MPFVVTLVVALLFSTYLLLDPARPLANFMQLTDIALNFKLFIIILALGGFACAWVAERRVFISVARMIGKAHDGLWPHRRKQRKQYKLLSEKMRI